jgi:hypothetical protein
LAAHLRMRTGNIYTNGHLDKIRNIVYVLTNHFWWAYIIYASSI